MSVQAQAYVLEGHPSKGAERLVLFSLANHASEHDMECWPSVDLIAYEANLTPDHVRRCLRALVQAGWITRAVNAAPDSRIPADRRPNLYRIVPGITPRVRAKRPPAEDPRVGQLRADGGDIHASTGRTTAPTKPSREPSPEPSKKTRAEEALVAAAFEDFWTLYPRKTAKGTARSAWPAAVKAAGGVGRILEGATRYAQDPNRDPTFTAHAATWLRGERWNDDPIPARSGTGPARNRVNVDQDRGGQSGRLEL